MKTYYVNMVVNYTDYTKRCIGLFDSNHWTGEGNFCGWYGAEFYTDSKLLAYYIIEVPGSSIYEPKGKSHLEEEWDHDITYEKIQIGSGYWEQKLYAENDEEAKHKFFREEYE